MSKMKKSAIISYNGLRINLDTIAAFMPIYTNKSNDMTKYGIKFFLRSGGIVETLGNDRYSRNKVIKFLDSQLGHIRFPSNMCEVCATRVENAEGNCAIEGCEKWERFPKFRRKSDAELPDSV